MVLLRLGLALELVVGRVVTVGSWVVSSVDQSSSVVLAGVEVIVVELVVWVARWLCVALEGGAAVLQLIFCYSIQSCEARSISFSI